MKIEKQLQDNVSEVDRILRKNWDKQIFRLKKDDQIRLLKLKMWTVRYKVSLEYILQVLVPHFSKLSSNHYIQRNKKGLGTTIPVLTGNAAEDLLKKRIAHDFPSNENVEEWKEQKKEECLLLAGVRIIPPKSILRFRSIVASREAYLDRIEKERRSEQRLVREISRQTWRDNPWR